MITVLISLFLCQPETTDESLLRTFKAVCWIESRGDPKAYNKAEDAAGIVQIRPIMVRDANRIIGYEKYTLADRWNPVKSWEIFRLVCRFYYPHGTPEQFARCWNGGPRGPKKPATLPYWLKVQRQMQEASR